MLTIKNILDKIEFIRFIGSKNQPISAPQAFDENNTSDDKIMWVNIKNSSRIHAQTHGIIICPEINNIPDNLSSNLIMVKNPRNTFRIILQNFFSSKFKPFISKNAIIDPSCKIGKGCYIGHHTVIEQNCIIGDHTYIGHNTVILAGTMIGSEVIIGNNTTIGGTGFGYEKDENGLYCLIPQIGKVIIEDKVEIGNNTSIDRGALTDTIIKKNVKIDNQVHIAHGVEIGKNSLIIANSMIAGSTKIGENVWIAPSSSIINKIEIGKGSFIGIGSVLLKSIHDNTKVFGNPAKPIN